jgi:hypothetical protein
VLKKGDYVKDKLARGCTTIYRYIGNKSSKEKTKIRKAAAKRVKQKCNKRRKKARATVPTMWQSGIAGPLPDWDSINATRNLAGYSGSTGGSLKRANPYAATQPDTKRTVLGMPDLEGNDYFEIEDVPFR